MLRIRLRRVGLKKQPSYRMVIAENEWPRDGRFLEIVGRYNPRTNPETVEVNEERTYHWLKNGAQPTESVAKLLTKQGTMGRFERVQKGEDLQAVLAEEPNCAEAHHQLGLVYGFIGEFERSLEELQKISGISRQSPTSSQLAHQSLDALLGAWRDLPDRNPPAEK